MIQKRWFGLILTGVFLLGLLISPEVLAEDGNQHTLWPRPYKTRGWGGIIYGHTEQINVVKFSPDGSLIASGGSDDLIILWNTTTGEEVRSLAGHTDDVLTLSFSNSGSWLCSGSRDGTIKLWDVLTGGLQIILDGHNGDPVTSLSYSPDGTTLASGSVDGKVILWDMNGTSSLSSLEGTNEHYLGVVRSLRYSPDSSKLAAIYESDSLINLWDINSYRLLNNLSYPRLGNPKGLAFSPDGSEVVIGMTKVIIKHSGHAEEEVGRIVVKNSFYIRNLVISPDGQIIAISGEDNELAFLNNSNGEELGVLTSPSWIYSIDYSPEGTLVAVASRIETTNTPIVTIWDIHANPPMWWEVDPYELGGVVITCLGGGLLVGVLVDRSNRKKKEEGKLMRRDLRIRELRLETIQKNQ